MNTTTTDWVLVAATLFLGAAALLAPLLSELLKRNVFAPKLTVSLQPNPPFCIKTFWRSAQDPTLSEPVFFCRLLLFNEGRSEARACEVVLEELWTYDASGKPTQLPFVSPQNLSLGTKNINPKRRVLAVIGHVSSQKHQQREEKNIFIDVPGHHREDELRFLFDQDAYPYNQPNCLVPGRYTVKISLCSENAPHQEYYFSIHWSGNWQETEQDMFRELVIRPTTRPNP